MEIYVIAAFLGLIPAAIASNKGYSFVLWWFFGAALFIVALPVALLMSPNSAAIEQNKLREGMKKCPFCAELVKAEAKVCKHCGREFLESASEEGDSARLLSRKPLPSVVDERDRPWEEPGVEQRGLAAFLKSE